MRVLSTEGNKVESPHLIGLRIAIPQTEAGP